MSKTDLGSGILDIVAEKTQIFASKGEARRMISSNAVSINKEKITEDFQLSENDLTKLKEITDQVLSKNSENSAAFARVLRSQVEFSESYKKWSQQGYLPNKY